MGVDRYNFWEVDSGGCVYVCVCVLVCVGECLWWWYVGG